MHHLGWIHPAESESGVRLALRCREDRAERTLSRAPSELGVRHSPVLEEDGSVTRAHRDDQAARLPAESDRLGHFSQVDRVQ